MKVKDFDWKKRILILLLIGTVILFLVLIVNVILAAFNMPVFAAIGINISPQGIAGLAITVWILRLTTPKIPELMKPLEAYFPFSSSA